MYLSRRLAFILVLTFLPSAALAQTSLNFPRVSFEPDALTGIAIANPTDLDARVTLTVRREDGTLLEAEGFANPVTVDVPGGSQYSDVTSIAFGSGPSDETVAWLQATSDVEGLTGFFLFLNSEVTLFDGADLPQLSNRLLFPDIRLEGDFSSEISLINPGPEPVDVELRLMQGTGPIERALRIEGNGTARLDLTTFFEIATPNGVDPDSPPPYLLAESQTGEIGGFALVRGAGDVLGLNGIPADQLLNTLFFPQLAVLPPFETEIIVVNGSTRSVIVTLEARREDGRLFGDPDLRTNPVTRALGPGEILKENAEELFGFTGEETLEGWLAIESTSESINGSLSYSIPGIGSVASVSSVSQGSREAIFSHIATTLGFFTGVAILNPSSLLANVVLTAIEPDGDVIGNFRTTLRPRERVSDLLTEFVPAAAEQAGGLISIRSDVPVFLTSLFGSVSSGVLANIPPQSVADSALPTLSQPLTVQPPLAVLSPGLAQSFRTVGGSSAPSWQVNGIEGGNQLVGVISPSGDYQAPTTMPAGLPISITARAANQTAGAAVDLLFRQTLIEGLGVVQSLAYLSGLERLYTAELSTTPGDSGAVRPRQAASSAVFDVTSGESQTVASFAGEEIPKMIGFLGADGREYLLLAARTSGRLLRLDPQARVTQEIVSGLNDPTALALDPVTEGVLVATAGALVPISNAALNRGLASASTTGGGSAPTLRAGIEVPDLQPGGIAINPCDGQVFVSSPLTGEVLVIDRFTGERLEALDGFDVPGQLLGLSRRAVSCPDSFQLLVTDPEAGQISLVTPQDGAVIRWDVIDGTTDLVFLPEGNPVTGVESVLYPEEGETAVEITQRDVPDLYDSGAINPPNLALSGPGAGFTVFDFAATITEVDASLGASVGQRVTGSFYFDPRQAFVASETATERRYGFPQGVVRLEVNVNGQTLRSQAPNPESSSVLLVNGGSGDPTFGDFDLFEIRDGDDDQVFSITLANAEAAGLITSLELPRVLGPIASQSALLEIAGRVFPGGRLLRAEIDTIASRSIGPQTIFFDFSGLLIEPRENENDPIVFGAPFTGTFYYDVERAVVLPAGSGPTLSDDAVAARIGATETVRSYSFPQGSVGIEVTTGGETHRSTPRSDLLPVIHVIDDLMIKSPEPLDGFIIVDGSPETFGGPGGVLFFLNDASEGMITSLELPTALGPIRSELSFFGEIPFGSLVELPDPDSASGFLTGAIMSITRRAP